VDAIRAWLSTISDVELIVFGNQMRGLVYPLSFDHNGQPTVTAFSIQLKEARAKWRWRRPRPNL
jgi:hypothetical protein